MTVVVQTNCLLFNKFVISPNQQLSKTAGKMSFERSKNINFKQRHATHVQTRDNFFK